MNIYNRQLFILGLLSILIAPLVLINAVLVYQLPMIDSISETATIANQTSFLLPLILGGLGLFGISYKSKYNSIGDKLCALLIGISFILVALQPCYSNYITQDKVGFFAITPEQSNIVHSISAITGFITLFIWQLFFFTKTKDKKTMTNRKKIRNAIYRVNSFATLIGVIIVTYLSYKSDNIPLIFWAEAVALSLSGLSCIIKSETIFKDKR